MIKKESPAINNFTRQSIQIICSRKKVLQVNASAKKLFKSNKTLVLNTLFTPNDAKKIKNIITAVFKHKKDVINHVFLSTAKNESKNHFVFATPCTVKNEGAVKLVLYPFSEAATPDSKAEELFELISNNNSHIIYMYDYEDAAKISFVSQSVKNVLGFSPAEFIGKKEVLKNILVKGYKYVFPSDKKKFLEIIRKQGAMTQPFLNKQKKIVWLETAVSEIKDKKGKTTSIIGIVKDITAQRDLEEQLINTQSQLHLIAKNAHDIIYFFTYLPKPRYLFISDSVERVLGYKPANFYKDPFFISKKAVEKDNELSRDEKLAPGQQKKGTTKQQKIVYRIYNAAGEKIWMEDHINPIFDNNGKISFLFGIVRNINQLKEKELELNQKWSDYKVLLDESPVAFFIHHNGVCLMCNKTGLQLLKLKSEIDVVGKVIIDFIHPDQRVRAIERMKRAADGEELGFLHYKIQNSKGETINVEIKTVPITYNGVKCTLSLVKDITQQEQAEKNKLRSELVEEHNRKLLQEIRKRTEAEQKLTAQKNKLSAIFENSQHLVWTINHKHEFTYFNKNFERLFIEKHGKKPEIGLIGQQLLKGKAREDYINFWEPYYSRVFNGEQLVFELEDVNLQGQLVFREVFINPIYSDSGEIVELSCMANDISENKKIERQIFEQSQRIKTIFDSGDQTIWTVDKKLKYTSFNQYFAEAFEEAYLSKPMLGRTFYDSAKSHPKAKEINSFWEEKYNAVLSGKSIEFVREIQRVNGNNIVRRFYLQPIYNEKKEIVEISGLGKEITEEVYTQQKIINQAAKLNSIFEGSSHYVWTVDEQNKLTSFNKNYSELVNKIYKTTPKIGELLNRGKMLLENAYIKNLEKQYKKAFAGSKVNFELELQGEEFGERVFLDVFLNPILEGGRVTEVSGIAHDITRSRLNEEAITQSLKEKEVLLKEVHHRVKNNMQIISSILNLQSSYTNDSQILTLLKESQNRIKTMAYIHESLYQNKTFSSINFNDYLIQLTNNIIHSYSVRPEQLKLLLNCERIILNLDVSIPLGLVINELVTNCIKHGFPDGKKGNISLNLTTQNKFVLLTVQDNGVGMRPGFSPESSGTLGLQLVYTLIDQIEGKIIFESPEKGGTKITIILPK